MSDTSPHGISPPTPARPRRWPLVAGAVAGGLVVLAAAGLLVLDSFLTSRARREAAALSQRLGRPVEVGGVATKVLGGLGVRVSEVRVGPAAGEELPLLEVRRVEVKAALLRALLSGGKDVRIRSAEVQGLRVNVVRLPDGTTNLERLQRALAAAEDLEALLDWERRHAHMRMHSCLHLLGAVLRYGVTGGQITAERGRLDFDTQEENDKDRVTAAVNALIAADHPVRSQWITDEELDRQPQLVRTMSVQPPRGAGRIRLLEIPGVDLSPAAARMSARRGRSARSS